MTGAVLDNWSLYDYGIKGEKGKILLLERCRGYAKAVCTVSSNSSRVNGLAKVWT